MPPAARIADMHTCPMSTGPVPHVGGPVAIGCPTVLIGGMPAARVGDMVTCSGPPDTIAVGSMSVMIGGMPAARMGDLTAHGGSIVAGFPQVMIGDQGGGPAPTNAAVVANVSVPVLKKSTWKSIASSFGDGVFDGIFNKGTLLSLAGKIAVACCANPAVAPVVGGLMAAYGAYSLYKTLNTLGDGSVWGGIKVVGKTLASGDPNTYAYLAGTIVGSAISDKAQDGVANKLGGMAKGSGAMNGLANAKGMSAVDDALGDTAKAAGNTSKLAKAGSGAAKAIDYSNTVTGAAAYTHGGNTSDHNHMAFTSGKGWKNNINPF